MLNAIGSACVQIRMIKRTKGVKGVHKIEKRIFEYLWQYILTDFQWILNVRQASREFL